MFSRSALVLRNSSRDHFYFLHYAPLELWTDEGVDEVVGKGLANRLGSGCIKFEMYFQFSTNCLGSSLIPPTIIFENIFLFYYLFGLGFDPDSNRHLKALLFLWTQV